MHTPATPQARVMFQRCVHTSQLTSEQLCHRSAKLQQLRLDIVQYLNRRFSPGGSVINQRGIPSHHDQIVWIVGKAGLEDIIILLPRERKELAAQDLGNLRPLLSQQVGVRAAARERHSE